MHIPAGIPLSTVRKIMSGATKAPRKSTLVAKDRHCYEQAVVDYPFFVRISII